MRIVVTAASMHGSTAQIADAIGEQLTAAGHDVHVQVPEVVRDLDGIDAVVLGSAEYAGRWQRPARKVVTRLGPELARRPVWMFSSGPVGDPPKPVGEAVDVAAASVATAARGHRIFAGHLDLDELGLGERAMVRVFRATTGDFRDWDEITGLAQDIDTELRKPLP